MTLVDPDAAKLLRVTPDLAVPMDEIEFSAARSGGPGGQHVNTTSSAVSLRFDVAGSPSLTEAQRALILERLASRLDKSGRLRVTAGEQRSQWRNRAAALQRLAGLLAQGLAEQAPRKATRVPFSERRRRGEAKQRRGRTKALRRSPRMNGRGESE